MNFNRKRKCINIYGCPEAAKFVHSEHKNNGRYPVCSRCEAEEDCLDGIHQNLIRACKICSHLSENESSYLPDVKTDSDYCPICGFYYEGTLSIDRLNKSDLPEMDTGPSGATFEQQISFLKIFLGRKTLDEMASSLNQIKQEMSDFDDFLNFFTKMNRIEECKVQQINKKYRRLIEYMECHKC